MVVITVVVAVVVVTATFYATTTTTPATTVTTFQELSSLSTTTTTAVALPLRQEQQQKLHPHGQSPSPPIGQKTISYPFLFFGVSTVSAFPLGDGLSSISVRATRKRRSDFGRSRLGKSGIYVDGTVTVTKASSSSVWKYPISLYPTHHHPTDHRSRHQKKFGTRMKMSSTSTTADTTTSATSVLTVRHKLKHFSSQSDDDISTNNITINRSSTNQTAAANQTRHDAATKVEARDYNDETEYDYELVLASQSPRRREILDMMGLSSRYRVQPSPLDESKLQEELRLGGLRGHSSNNATKNEERNGNSSRNTSSPLGIDPVEYTKRLAEAKAEALAIAELEQHFQLQQQQEKKRIRKKVILYLGSDTIVEIDDKILEKPNSVEEAQTMLSTMSGRQHHVHTGVALYGVAVPVSVDAGNNSAVNILEKVEDKNSNGYSRVTLLASFVETATVEFAVLSLEDIDAYIETGEPMDKAGSYGIQGIGGQFVTNISGDFFTVMGLPMHRTSTLLASALS